ncbi:MAG: FtsW/RodA/SpoVE family cell cycle protein [Myxococcota bacterium]
MRCGPACEPPRDFTRCWLRGVASLWNAHVAVSVGASLGLFPALAVALPLGSYGGSNVVVSMVALGLAARVVLRNRHHPRGTGASRSNAALASGYDGLT